VAFVVGEFSRLNSYLYPYIFRVSALYEIQRLIAIMSEQSFRKPRSVRPTPFPFRCP